MSDVNDYLESSSIEELTAELQSVEERLWDAWQRGDLDAFRRVIDNEQPLSALAFAGILVDLHKAEAELNLYRQRAVEVSKNRL